MIRMRVHLVSLPHTETTKAYSWCAFTEKARKLSNMLDSLGYDVRLYAGEVNEARCTEHIPLVSRAEQAEWFGAYDWRRDVFNEFDSAKPYWQAMNNRAIEAIRQRMEPGDILSMTMGWSQKPIADALPDLIPVETGIGYKGVWAPYRVIESYAWQHFLQAKEPTDDIRWFDTVIPNSFEAEDFPLGKGEGGYLLFLGRFIRRKGVEVAVETARALDMSLLMAGQGVIAFDPKENSFRGIDIEVKGPHIQHLGVVGPAERAKLIGGAAAVVCASYYLEPFCGVAVESQMCGTPVLATDHGAFLETIRQGVSGFRCRTLADFVRAAEQVEQLDRKEIREYAVAHWSTDVLRWRYDRYFQRLQALHNGGGWYSLSDPSQEIPT